VVTNNNLLNIL